jgi:hypothetical protein
MNDGQDEAQAEVAQESPDRAQEGDMAETDGPRMLVGNAAAGGARLATRAEEPGEIRQRRGEGRRINLRRSTDGSYSLWMGGRLIQSFCSEWEDVTRFQLPEGIQQQVRVNVQSLGEAREWDGREVSGQDRVEEVRPDDGVALRSIAHPNNPMAREDITDDLIGMFNALPRHNQSVIAGQIRANYAEVPTEENLNELRAAVEVQQRLRHHPAPPVPEGGDVWEHILGLLHDEVQRVHQLMGTVEAMRQR